MKISLEQLGRMKARRAQPAPRRGLTSGGLPWLQPVLLVAGVLFAVTFIADMVGLSRGGKTTQAFWSVSEEIQSLKHDLTAGARYTATNGLFSIVQPTGWRVQTGEDVAPYDVCFASPNGVTVSLSAARVAFDDLPTLFAEMIKREREYGAQSEIQTAYFHGRPAARREVRLLRTQALVIDFVTNHVAHQIFCNVPLECFEQYKPALLKLVETYQPNNPPQR